MKNNHIKSLIANKDKSATKDEDEEHEKFICLYLAKTVSFKQSRIKNKHHTLTIRGFLHEAVHLISRILH